jgi:hypothetical protein
MEECDHGSLLDAPDQPFEPVTPTSLDSFDDGYIDDHAWCNADCQVECFDSAPRAWAKSYEDETCIFVPEPVGDDTAMVYDDLYIEPVEGTQVYPGFGQAEAYCAGLGIGAHLVKVQTAQASENAAKNTVVANVVTASVNAAGSDAYCPLRIGGVCVFEDLDEPLPVGLPYWIGAYDDHTTQADPPGYWKWIGDGSLMSGGNNGGANPLWDGPNNEPNDLDADTTTPGEEDCAAIIGEEEEDAATEGRWQDRNCDGDSPTLGSWGFRFVCEFPLQPAP